MSSGGEVSEAVKEFLESFERFAKASNVLLKHDELLVFRMMVEVQTLATERAKEYVRRHLRVPLMITYQNDSTKNRVSELTVEKVDGVGETRALNWSTGDVLVERLFITAGPGPRGRSHPMVFRPPLKCKDGKGALVCMNARVTMFPTLMELGHRAPGVLHYVWDRALKEAFSRVTHAFHEDLIRRTYPDGGQEARKARLRTLIITEGCRAHDLQNALHWSMHSLGCSREYSGLFSRSEFWFRTTGEIPRGNKSKEKSREDNTWVWVCPHFLADGW
jgi:hypothetical protein